MPSLINEHVKKCLLVGTTAARWLIGAPLSLFAPRSAGYSDDGQARPHKKDRRTLGRAAIHVDRLGKDADGKSRFANVRT
ncbi:hypothetical protein [Flavisphingomonas formosensis]|uniref:hypothetical protein n=1 Tax=Flavisphingomonas formosensis TaxID=861534 RepID=UPI0012FC82ED|nr:hypothetical protein [Sphingomonas formosensis]